MSNVQINATVYGIHTHGKLAGKTNPKASADLTVFGESVKDALKNLQLTVDGAFYKVKEVLIDGEVSTFERKKKPLPPLVEKQEAA